MQFNADNFCIIIISYIHNLLTGVYTSLTHLLDYYFIALLYNDFIFLLF